MSSDSQEKSQAKTSVKQSIESSLFNALQNIDIEQLEGRDISLVLPFLTKLLLSPSFVKKRQLLKLLYPIRKMNDVIQLMLSKSIDSCDALVPAASFEYADYTDKLRIVAIEYMRIQERARQSNLSTNANLKLLQSDLFDNPIYLDDISYSLYVLLSKSTNIPVLNILDMTEALLHVKFGPTYIIRLVANMPDRCQEVCHSLVTFGEKQDEGANFNEVSEQRAKTLRALCQMNPSLAFTVRSLTIQMRKMPSLTIMITLDHLNEAMTAYNSLLNDQYSESTNSTTSPSRMDVEDTDEYALVLTNLEDTYDSAVAFVTGILLGVDEEARTWFAQYTKSAQQKRIDLSHYTILSQFRSQILAYMNCLFSSLLEMDYTQNGRSNDDNEKEALSSEAIKSKLNARELNRKLIRATATLRLFCALRSIGSLKLNSEESEILLRLITCKPVVNQTSVNFATTGVCTLLSCSALINNQKEERRAGEWLKWLIKESNYNDTRHTNHGKCPISELLLLIAIHFQNNQNNQIAELVCSTLGMKLHIKTSVSKCKSLFVQEVFFDKMIAEHAVKVPVTKNLNDSIKEFLPVHCIHQLLEHRSFSKHQVAIKNWIFEQICQSKKPIHNIMPNLIEAYVNSVIIPTSSHGYCGTNEAIPEEYIARVFKTKLYSVDRSENSTIVNKLENGVGDHSKIGKVMIKKAIDCDSSVPDSQLPENGVDHEQDIEIVDVEAAQVLLLYYLLLYEDTRLKKNADMYSTQRTNLIKYSADFIMEIPIFYLLQLARDKQSSFSAILPDLLKLVTSQYPQLCSIQHWLTIEHYDLHTCDKNEPLDSASVKEKDGISAVIPKLGGRSQQNPVKAIKQNFMKQLVDGFDNLETDNLSLARTMSQILVLPREEIWPFVHVFVEKMSKIVRLEVSDSPEYKKLIQVATKLWWKFNTILPRKLWVMTVNSLIRPQNFRTGLDVRPVEYSWDELALDPLIVLRCDSRVFRCVDTLSIVLHILSAFLAASRRCLQDQIDEQPSRQKDTRNLEELRATLILAQTSAAIQILLESCMPTEEEQVVLNKQESGCELNSGERLMIERFDASVNCICEHLHQVFIADTNLAKLVHFQTYSSELLSTTSDKIPSMHICLDFIPELLSQPDLSKQVFVIELTSHLCEKYAITKSLNVAKLCFNVAYTLLQLLPSERRALFFIPVLPALLRICKVFPILREDAEIILTQINQISIAHLASTSSRLSLGSARPFEGLETMSWMEAKKLMSTLSLHEALYLCINKCSLDLYN